MSDDLVRTVPPPTCPGCGSEALTPIEGEGEGDGGTVGCDVCGLRFIPVIEPRPTTSIDIKVELIAVPVTDVDRAKEFYVRAGFNADHDHTVSDELRFAQLTPPGSACSIALGNGLTGMQPGSLDNLQAVVADADAARTDLLERGIEVSEVDSSPGVASSTSPTPTATAGRCSSCRTGRRGPAATACSRVSRPRPIGRARQWSPDRS
jgi:hypothetical protein